MGMMLSFAMPSYAFSDQVIQKGATGDDVVELQSRLQYIGFYNGKIDGVYGWSTYWAVRNYQDQFGLDVDGLVGPKMKDMLERSTDYDEEFVQKALNEGRAFSHYGTTPKHIQQGPKGSANQKARQQGQAGQGQQQQGQAGQGQQQQGQAGQDEQQQGQAGQGQQQQGQAGQDEQQQGQAGQDEQQQGQAGQDEQQQGQAGQGQQQQGQADQGQQQTPAEQTPQADQPAQTDEQQDNNANIQKATNVPPGYSDNDIQLMAQAVYGEARGEPYVGQVAIAAVILNRLNSPTFPNTVSGVIFEPRAFTAVADGQIYMTPNETSRRAVLDAINGQDPTGNAMYYFNPDTATSGWIWSRPQIKRIGKHIFCH
ncbi:spore cortex-lytic enzyme [Halalkalibacter urbisdiaboli]|uniref:spore cortex-lytic enzyme n=1 Tax=Halalkalibacter urbisdiaboli TaxID=1960589 RepID=UPI003CCA67AC